jgi:heme exporter protein B
VLVLPLYVPVLVFGLSASQGDSPEIATPSLLILAAIALVSLVVSPLASAAALRSYLK